MARMALYVSNLRPEHAPIFAFTPSDQVYRQLALCWGTFPLRINFADDPNVTIDSRDEMFARCSANCVEG